MAILTTDNPSGEPRVTFIDSAYSSMPKPMAVVRVGDGAVIFTDADELERTATQMLSLVPRLRGVPGDSGKEA